MLLSCIIYFEITLTRLRKFLSNFIVMTFISHCKTNCNISTVAKFAQNLK